MKVILTPTRIDIYDSGFVLPLLGTDMLGARIDDGVNRREDQKKSDRIILIDLAYKAEPFELNLAAVENLPRWSNDDAGARLCLEDIRPIIRSAPVAGGVPPKNSIEFDAGQLQLVGDQLAPGADMVYGTDGAGAKGWKADPSAGGMTDLTGDVTGTGPGSTPTTIAANAVTTAKIINDAVTNAKLANMAQATIKGRTAGSGTGDPQDLTADQTSTILDGAADPFLRSSAAVGGLTYLGVWNATTNTPALASGVGVASTYYRVNVAGTTTLDGISDWGVGDWVIFNGTAWDKIDNTDQVTSVFGRQGPVVATSGDYTASQVTNVPAGNIAATDVQAALNELDAEKQPLDSDLTAIAALTTTAYGRDLLTRADAAATRAYIGAGTGDMVGPGSAVDNAVARYDLTTGKLIQSSPVLITDSGAIHIPNIATPTLPAAGSVGVFSRGIANRQLVAQIGPSGLTTALQPLLARNKVAIWNPAGNAVNAPGVFGVAPLTIQGSAVARNVATTNLFTRTKRLGYNTSAVAGQLAGIRGASLQYTTGDGAGLGGFFWVCRFGISGNTTDSRIIVGIRVTTGAATNVEPSTLNNIVAVGKGAADTDFSIFYGGSAAQTPIALGANFPANTTDTDFYELALFSSPFQTGTVDYQFTRLNTGDVASGTLSGGATVIPASTQPFNFCNISICNNATASIVAVDVASVYMETDH